MTRLSGVLRSWGLFAVLLGAPAAALLLVAGCHNSSVDTNSADVKSVSPAAEKAASVAMVGSAVCAECHKVEAGLCRFGNHAKTLQNVDKASLGPLAPPMGPIAGTAYSISEQDGKLRFSRSDLPDAGIDLRYAFGSGKTVNTYIGDVGPDRLTELRMTYAPKTRVWHVTPSQERTADLKLGKVYEMGMATRCVLCHADQLAPGSAGPAPESLGVGCESCHGPGAAHVAAARDPKATDMKIERLGQWSASRIDAMCGKCHRSADDIALVGNDTGNTTRFQPYALEMSPCFRKSGGKLSCVTCHDPHTDVSKDNRKYEQICLSCHGASSTQAAASAPRPGGQGSGPGPAAAAHRKICPVNPRDKCIGCHMPKRPIFTTSHISIYMADHLIWAYPNAPGHPHHQ